MSELEKIILEKLDNIQKDINEIRVNVAVHEVKIGRSSAFFGAISGLVVAILTGVIINYVSNPLDTAQPKVIYKEELKKESND